MLSLPGVLLMYDDTAFIELSLLLFFSSHFDLFFPFSSFQRFLVYYVLFETKMGGFVFFRMQKSFKPCTSYLDCLLRASKIFTPVTSDTAFQ